MVEWNGAERCVKVNLSRTIDERERNQNAPTYKRTWTRSLVTLTAGSTVRRMVF